MIEGALARTFRNFSTIFMVVAVVVFPLHLLYAFTFRNVIATSDFHDAIEAMPNYRQVRSAGPPQLDDARLVFWVLTAVEVVLLPFAVRATRRVFTVDEEAGIPTASEAWSEGVRHRTGRSLRPGWIPLVGTGLVGAVVAGVLIDLIGSDITGFLSEDWRWAGEGLTQAVARAGALPLFLGPMALARAKEEAPPTPKVY